MAEPLRSPAFLAEMDQAYGAMKDDLDFLTKLAAVQVEAAKGDLALATGWTVRMLFEQEDLTPGSPRTERWHREHLGAALVRLAELTKPNVEGFDG